MHGAGQIVGKSAGKQSFRFWDQAPRLCMISLGFSLIALRVIQTVVKNATSYARSGKRTPKEWLGVLMFSVTFARRIQKIHLYL